MTPKRSRSKGDDTPTSVSKVKAKRQAKTTSTGTSITDSQSSDLIKSPGKITNATTASSPSPSTDISSSRRRTRSNSKADNNDTTSTNASTGTSTSTSTSVTPANTPIKSISTSPATTKRTRTGNKSKSPHENDAIEHIASDADTNAETMNDITTLNRIASTDKVSSKKSTISNKPENRKQLGVVDDTKVHKSKNQPMDTDIVDNEEEEDKSVTTVTTKPEPTLDVIVHRIRHLNYHPKPILAIASTTIFYNTCNTTASSTSAINESNNTIQQQQKQQQQQQQQPPDSFVAVSRESGCIELQTIHPKWRTISVIAGHINTPITSLTWITIQPTSSTHVASSNNNENEIDITQAQRPVLVGVNRNDLYIVDFWDRQQLICKHSCTGGNIFVIHHLFDNYFVIGSQDGAIRIYTVNMIEVEAMKSTTPTMNKNYTYQFELVSTIPTAGEAVLSLTHIPSKDQNKDELIGTTLFAGIADGTIRRYDCSASNYHSIGRSSATASATSYFTSSSAGVIWKSTLRMTVECYGRSTPTLVWTMKAMSDGTIVSGDSLGHIQFWDGLTGTLISTFDQNDSTADVLALDITSDECKVFGSGVDSRVVCIERQMISSENSNMKWIMTHAQRPHTHDVKAMSIVQKFKVGNNGKILKQTEILFTGGIDTKLSTCHVSEFGLRRPRSFYPWPSLHSPIVAANKAKIITMLREDCIDLYELAKAPSNPQHVQNPIVAADEQSLIGTINVKGLSNLSICAISPSATFLALCDSYSVFLFHLQIETTKYGERKVITNSISFPFTDLSSIVAIQFVQESHLVLATSDNVMQVFSIVKAGESYHTSLVQSIRPTIKDEVQKVRLLPIHNIFCTTDGLWITTIRNSCDQTDGVVDVYRHTSNNGYQFWWTIPTLSAVSTAVSFLENDITPFLAVACVNYTWYIFDLEQKRLSDWSIQAGYPLTTNKIPSDLASRNDYPIRISTNPANPSVMLIVS
jgi:hypothetical protein